MATVNNIPIQHSPANWTIQSFTKQNNPQTDLIELISIHKMHIALHFDEQTTSNHSQWSPCALPVHPQQIDIIKIVDK